MFICKITEVKICLSCRKHYDVTFAENHAAAYTPCLGPHRKLFSLGFYQIRPGVDPRQGKKGSKRASKTKGFTWNAAILVAVSARYSKGSVMIFVRYLSEIRYFESRKPIIPTGFRYCVKLHFRHFRFRFCPVEIVLTV